MRSSLTTSLAPAGASGSIRAHLARVGRGMKLRKKIAIVALARKLLVILWAMLRTNTPWRAVAPGDLPAPCA